MLTSLRDKEHLKKLLQDGAEIRRVKADSDLAIPYSGTWRVVHRKDKGSHTIPRQIVKQLIDANELDYCGDKMGCQIYEGNHKFYD